MTFGTGLLKIGSTGAGVTELQQWLIDRQFLIATSTPTGTFDASTDQAVKAFQLSAGLMADGEVGDGTRTAAEGYAGNAQTGGWHPSAIRNIQTLTHGGSYTTTTRRGILHTTQGTGLPDYGGSPSHFTIGRNGAGQPVQLWQHFPTTVASKALAAIVGVPPETNRHGAIQIESIGFAEDSPTMATADAEKFQRLGELMRWVEANTGVERLSEHAFAGTEAKESLAGITLSAADWEASRGWLGHQHVPENLGVHWDPGKIDIAALLAVPAAGAAWQISPVPSWGPTVPSLARSRALTAIGAIPVIRATTRALSNAFPSLTFAVDPGGMAYFEVLLTTSAALFHPQNAGQRTAQNFYASRVDGLIRTEDAYGNYIAPVAVISGFAQANPDGGQIYYTIVGYADAAGNAPVPAAAPEVLARSAASVPMMPGFRGHTRTETLGVPLSMLKPAVRTAALGRSSPPVSGQGRVGLLSYGPPGPYGATTPAVEDPRSADRLEGEDGYDVRARQTVLMPLPMPQPSTAPGNGTQPGNGARPVNPVPPPPVSSVAPPPPPPPPSPAVPPPPPPASAAARRVPLRVSTAGYDDGWGAWDDASNGRTQTTLPAGRAQPRNLSGEPSEVPVNDEYDDLGWRGSAYAETEVAPLPTPVSATRAEPVTLTDEQKRAVIETYVGADSDLYAATSADVEYAGGAGTDHPAYQRYHLGLGYGIVAFSQDKYLGQLLTLMNDRDPAKFAEVFGPDQAELLTVTNRPGPLSRDVPDGRSTRVQPVAGNDLWTELWLSRFRAAGAHLPFRGAQIQLAAGLFLDPVTRFASDLGLATPRGLAIVFDRAAHRDVVNGMTWVIESVGPLQSTQLRDQALHAVGAESVEAFQRSQPDLLVDDQFGPLSHAALTGMLRALVAAGGVSPVPLPSYQQLIDGLGARATGQPWGDRIVRLIGDPSIPDSFEAVTPVP